MVALLGFHVGIWDYAAAYAAHAHVADATVVQEKDLQKGQEKKQDKRTAVTTAAG
jgi:hypothetical protein